MAKLKKMVSIAKTILKKTEGGTPITGLEYLPAQIVFSIQLRTNFKNSTNKYSCNQQQ